MASAPFGLLSYEKANPLRSPRWRYDRALHLATHRPHPLTCSRSNDDAWIAKARSYLLRNAACARGLNDLMQIEMRRRRLVVRFPALHNAYRLFFSDQASESLGSGHQRYAIEARILAGLSNIDIARRCSVIPGAIEYYEKLFFNVRDRLDAYDYIVGQIVTPVYGVGLQQLTLELTAKYFGYFAGPVVLEYVLNSYDTSIIKPKSSKQLDSFFDNHFSKAVRRRAAEAASTMELNRWNVMQLFEVHSMLIAEARLRDRDLGNSGQYEENMRLLLSSVNWTTGKDARKAMAQSPIGEYLNGQFELRADELATLTHNAPPTALLTQVKRDLNRPPRKESNREQSDEEAL